MRGRNLHLAVTGLLLLFPWAILLFIGLMAFLRGLRAPRVGPPNPRPRPKPPDGELEKWSKAVLERDEG